MATKVSQIIIQAFLDCGALAAGETPNTEEQADALLRLNQMVSSWSNEELIVWDQKLASFSGGAASAFTFGSGGTWSTSGTPRKIVAWRATSGTLVSGGAPLPMAEFDAAAQMVQQNFARVAAQIAGIQSEMAAKVAAMEAELVAKSTEMLVPFNATASYSWPSFSFPTPTLASSAVPLILGANTAWPLISVRVYPATSATIEITYWNAIPAFAAVTDDVTLPDGFEEALHFNLALALYPQYARSSGPDPLLIENARRTKGVIVALNSPSRQPGPPPALPQQQQQAA